LGEKLGDRTPAGRRPLECQASLAITGRLSGEGRHGFGVPARSHNRTIDIVTIIARWAHRDRGLIQRRLASQLRGRPTPARPAPRWAHLPRYLTWGHTLRMQLRGSAQRAAPVSRARGRHQVAKSIEWYYGDRGKIVGPMSFEEVAGRINRARNEKHLVWTEGMARWTDAKTVPAFTDLFRTNPLPLPALALSSLSSEDEIVWIKPGSRASPPMLPVLRMPPVWRDEPSAIAQPLNDASPSPVMLLTLWRREVRHLGSTVTLLLGTLAFFGAASRIGNGDPLVAGVLTAGLVLILGALVYRSAKRRRLGEVASTPARWVLEGIAIVLMFLIVLLPAAGLSVLFR
jgi:hypothetical protein